MARNGDVAWTKQISHLQNFAWLSRRIAQSVELPTIKPKDTRHPTIDSRRSILHRCTALLHKPDAILKSDGSSSS